MLLLDTQPTLALLHNDHPFIEMISPDGPFQQQKRRLEGTLRLQRGLLYLEMCCNDKIGLVSETVQEWFEAQIPQSLI